jgi:hypothetical protein
MSRPNSLYVDVLAIDNIIAAIDRAEEQLFDGIDAAMACNVVCEPAAPPQAAATLPRRSRDQRPEPAIDAYSAAAARVDRKSARNAATHTATAIAAAAAAAAASAAAATATATGGGGGAPGAPGAYVNLVDD